MPLPRSPTVSEIAGLVGYHDPEERGIPDTPAGCGRVPPVDRACRNKEKGGLGEAGKDVPLPAASGPPAEGAAAERPGASGIAGMKRPVGLAADRLMTCFVAVSWQASPA